MKKQLLFALQLDLIFCFEMQERKEKRISLKECNPVVETDSSLTIDDSCICLQFNPLLIAIRRNLLSRKLAIDSETCALNELIENAGGLTYFLYQK